MLRHSLHPLFVAASLLILAEGCTINPGKATDTGTGGKNSNGTTDRSAARKGSCNDVSACVTACARGDTSCEGACIDNGTANGQTKFRALDACLTTSSCQDTACLQTECSSQIAACNDDVASTEPNGTTTPTPTGGQGGLVGAWESFDTAAGKATSFTFNSDGTYRKIFVFTDPSPTCTFFKKRTIVDDGRAKIDGNTLTIVPSETLQTMISCADTESGNKTISLDDTYKFSVAGNTLTLTDTTNNQVSTFTRK